MEKSSQKSQQNKMGLWQTVSIAVGTMIGASIFSIFGVGAQIAKQNLPESFLLSGLYAFIVAYSYAKLGPKIISNAGPIAFILKAIGDNIATGTLSILIWMTYVVSISLFAKGFAGYFLPLFNLELSGLNMTLVIIIIVLFFTILNFFGSRTVGKLEFYIVAIKLCILMVFIIFGFMNLKVSQVIPIYDAPAINGLIHASVIFFLSYMGFGLITNASENITNAVQNIPRAIYVSIIIVMFIYIAVALTAVGNLSLTRLIAVKENALAVAAQPFLGKFGFLLITIGALFSISSALNATLYGGANISYSLAKDGELPVFFERKIWFKSVEGLYITSGLSILFAIIFNMNGIAAITSSIFTIIYIFVLISHYRLVKEVGGNKFVIMINIFILNLVFMALLYYQWMTQKSVLIATVSVILSAVLIEIIYRNVRNRFFEIENKILRKSYNSN
jgi:amino acid transporter